MLNVPLIGASSELGYRSEPHGMILLTAACRTVYPAAVRHGEVYPGWCEAGGYWRGTIPGTNPEARLRAYLMNIRVLLVHTAV